MKAFFGQSPGVLVRLPLDIDPSLCNLRYYDLKPAIAVREHNSVVTSLSLSDAVNVQVTSNIGTGLDIVVFGDRPRQVSLSGLSFPCVCPETEPGEPNLDKIDRDRRRTASRLGNKNGASLIWGWYESYKASARREPISVAIGDKLMRAFVVSFTSNVSDVSLAVSQWNLGLVGLPEKSRA